ncbi:MAG: alpha/beta hydrolase [Idiomarina sp.]|nr:alpha/beta hydrolase [Idiomarina sp.]
MHILCLHSSQSSGAQWRPLKQTLSDAFPHAHIYTPNLIGYGRGLYDASHPAVADFRLANEVDALAPLLDDIYVDPDAVKASRPQPLHLIGHSYGGALALRIARLLTNAGTPPASITLYEPVAFHVLPNNDPARKEILEISAKMDELEPAQAAAAFVDYWNQPGYFGALPAKVQQGMITRQMKVQADFSALIQEPATLEDYAGLTVPVLLMHGRQSPQSSRRVAELLANTLPEVTTAEIDGGHMTPLTQPNAISDRVLIFLKNSLKP